MHVNHGPFVEMQNSHCSTDSTNVDLAGDWVNWDVNYFDAEVLASLVKGSMGRRGNNPMRVLISTRPLREKRDSLTSQAR